MAPHVEVGVKLPIRAGKTRAILPSPEAPTIAGCAAPPAAGKGGRQCIPFDSRRLLSYFLSCPGCPASRKPGRAEIIPVEPDLGHASEGRKPCPSYSARLPPSLNRNRSPSSSRRSRPGGASCAASRMFNASAKARPPRYGFRPHCMKKSRRAFWRVTPRCSMNSMWNGPPFASSS